MMKNQRNNKKLQEPWEQKEADRWENGGNLARKKEVKELQGEINELKEANRNTR